MKKLVLVICLALGLPACKKTGVTPYQSQGVITGYDERTCAMCGGLMVTIMNDTTKNAPPHYNINKNLQQLGIGSNKSFPINVSLNWMHDTTTLGSYGYIIVTKIKVLN